MERTEEASNSVLPEATAPHHPLRLKHKASVRPATPSEKETYSNLKGSLAAHLPGGTLTQ